ncbi:MAG TPA: hypothetical protein VE912_21120 [Bacteroidales bacterium]|nr:hypothetical protein [Bacteroidales bacterium]
MNGIEPTWIDILTALLTPTIALAAVLITWQQVRISRNRLKHELFDRRYKLYEAARDLIGHSVSRGHPTDEELFDFVLKTRESEFLFDKNVSEYLNEIYNKAVDIQICHAEMEGLVGEEKSKNIDERRELLKFMGKQPQILRDKFASYLKLKH